MSEEAVNLVGRSKRQTLSRDKRRGTPAGVKSKIKANGANASGKDGQR